MSEALLIKTVIVVLIIAISTSIHEAMHALVAYKLGDPTGKNMGRITLNPIKHIDLFFTILMPAMLLIASGGRFAFGGAKPVPINHLNFRNPKVGLALSAGVGPISNFVIAGIGLLIWIGLYKISPSLVSASSYNAYLLYFLIVLNIVLAIFNLIPIPPLDGSRVFRLILPDNIQNKYDSLELIGFFLIIILVVSRVLDPIFTQALLALHSLLVSIFDFEYILELVRMLRT